MRLRTRTNRTSPSLTTPSQSRRTKDSPPYPRPAGVRRHIAAVKATSRGRTRSSPRRRWSALTPTRFSPTPLQTSKLQTSALGQCAPPSPSEVGRVIPNAPLQTRSPARRAVALRRRRKPVERACVKQVEGAPDPHSRLLHHVQINLRRLDAFMTHEILHGANIRP